jgi:hypothetical protein
MLNIVAVSSNPEFVECNISKIVEPITFADDIEHVLITA